MAPIGKSIAASAVLALVLSVAAASVVTVSATPAFAERGGNGNGGGNGKDKGSREKSRSENARGGNGNGRGQLASELRGLNAAHANQNALMNASPNSMPGKLYVYQQAAIEAAGAEAELKAAQAEFDRLIGLNEEEIAAEFPDDGYEDAVTQAAIDLENAETTAGTVTDTANDALLEASGGRELSDAAMDELKRLLGL